MSRALDQIYRERGTFAPAADAEMERTQTASDVRAALDKLQQRARRIVEMRHGVRVIDTMTFAEIGAHFGLSRERARQIYGAAMSRLRHPSISSGLRIELK